jgi:hypothetical protein
MFPICGEIFVEREPGGLPRPCTPRVKVALSRCQGVKESRNAREGLLPIDAKFPHDSFERVVATAKAGNPAEDFFARAEIHLTFFQAVSGVERGQDDRAGCLARWEYPQPLPTRRRGAH